MIVDVISVTEDVCIACGTDAKVAAYIYARYQSGVTAAFCAHHGRAQWDDLIIKGATIIDRSHLLHPDAP